MKNLGYAIFWGVDKVYDENDVNAQKSQLLNWSLCYGQPRPQGAFPWKFSDCGYLVCLRPFPAARHITKAFSKFTEKYNWL